MMENKKRICFVVSAPVTAHAFFKDHMATLSKDFDVYLVGNFKSKDDVKGLTFKEYKSIRIERQPAIWADIKAVFALYKYIKETDFFVVHAMASKPSLIAAIASWMARTPHRIRIFTGQRWCNMKGWKREFFKTIDRITVALNTELMADGHPQVEYLVEQKIVKEGQVFVPANGSICGIDTERFSYSPEIREEERRKLNLSDEVCYMFLGRCKRDKGIYELLEATNLLVADHPKAKLILVGADEELCQDHLDEYPNLKDGENVVFYGFTQSPQRLLQAADVFVMPSYREGFGLSVLEASCVNLPVICSDIYGMRDTMIEGETGLRCKVGDTESLYKCMKTLYPDPELRAKMGAAGRERVNRLFTKKIVTEAWREYYLKLK